MFVALHITIAPGAMVAAQCMCVCVLQLQAAGIVSAPVILFGSSAAHSNTPSHQEHCLHVFNLHTHPTSMRCCLAATLCHTVYLYCTLYTRTHMLVCPGPLCIWFVVVVVVFISLLPSTLCCCLALCVCVRARSSYFVSMCAAVAVAVVAGNRQMAVSKYTAAEKMYSI